MPPNEVGVTARGASREEGGLEWAGLVRLVRGRPWSELEDGRRYGFVSAGGDPWYSRTLRALPVGARVFVHIAKAGYVAVGETPREARRFDEAEVLVEARVRS